MKYIILMLLLNGSAWGAFPTMEGLFRGGDNNNIAAEGIIINFELKKIMAANEVASDDQNVDAMIKWTMINSDDGKLKIIQEVKNEKSLVDLKLIMNTRKELQSNTDKERTLFISTLLSVIWNNSTFVSDFLSLESPDYISNKQIINQEKVALLNEYKKKLIVQKELSELTIPDEEKEKYKKAMTRSLYDQRKNIELVRKNKDFFWQLKMSNIEALFEVNTRKLKELIYQKNDRQVAIGYDGYILYNGMHSLPKIIRIKINETDIYEVKTNSLKHISKYDTRRLLKNYQQLKKEMNQSAATRSTPFVF